MAILVFFSVDMTKLYETQASELSIVALLHDYNFLIITAYYSQPKKKAFKRKSLDKILKI